MNENTQMVKRTDGVLQSVNEYIDEQIELLKTKFNLPPSAIERNEVVKDGKYWVLRKRENPITIFDDGDNARSVVASLQSYGDKMFKDSRTGKYNDAAKLGTVQAYGGGCPDVGETEAVVGGF